MKRIEYNCVVQSYGEDILHSPGMQQCKHFKQHGTTSVFEHTHTVACMCVKLARALRLRVDERQLVRGALLHDYFLYDWHDRATARPHHAMKHGAYALENAQRDFSLGAIERDMIAKHMFPLTLALPSYKETWLLCAADKVVSLQETVAGMFRSA